MSPNERWGWLTAGFTAVAVLFILAHLSPSLIEMPHALILMFLFIVIACSIGAALIVFVL